MKIDAYAQFHPEVTSRLSEREVRVAGHTSNNLIVVRAMLANSSAGGTIQTKGGTLPLTSIDVQAILALLIERSEQYLSSLGIELDGPLSHLTAN